MAKQLKRLGAEKIVLFGSLARDEISLFSDVDLLVVFDDPRSARELTRWVYQNVDAREGVDILAYNHDSLRRLSDRPFLRQILQEGRVLHERSKK